MIITIDGPAGTGKTTVAKLLSKQLHIIYFDTGALYRAFTWFYFQKLNNKDINEQALSVALDQFDLKIECSQGVDAFKYVVLGQDVTMLIRSIEVTEQVSDIAAVRSVRSALIPFQRSFAENNAIVVEGRDTGSVIFPKAEYKFFLTASLKVRAGRRFAEYQGKNIECTLEQIESSIAKRDHIDSNREVAPLICPDSAYVVKTDDKVAEKVAEEMFNIVKGKI
ncbi:cytidylate kinase [Candidatus Aerophobetes bacterium]|uniref:Cytidylate kinase n=1 Tax=Aerophobetes bacterium TaxID=2030807 RepID=A0A2A4X185_UNCAE|nr:MAG: cytidylate kinase [Candidatus Aerophobetes bacterium]